MLKDCEIETLDEYKGLLNDHVIFSTVRSNEARLLGIVKDPNRINTLINIAKRGLIIIGKSYLILHYIHVTVIRWFVNFKSK